MSKIEGKNKLSHCYVWNFSGLEISHRKKRTLIVLHIAMLVVGAMMLVLHFTGNYISAIKGIWRGVGFTFISRFDHCSLTRNSSKNAQPQIAPRTIIAAFGKGSQSISSISTITSQWKVTLEVLQTYPNI